MTDENTEVTASPVVPAEVVSAPVVTNPADDPKWIAQRLERHTKAILADLGVNDVKDAKEALAELKRRQDAEKSEMERLQSEIATLKAQASRAAALETAVKAQADNELAALTEAQRDFVQGISGNDPARAIQVIADMKAKGLLTVPNTAAAAPQTPQVPKPVANTAPSKGSPSEPGTAPPPMTDQQRYDAAIARGDRTMAARLNAANGYKLKTR